MPDLNAVIATAGAGFTAVVSLYTAVTGYRSKGKDQHLARETAGYDQLQEDNDRLRKALEECETRCGRERERADREREMRDRDHGSLMAAQDVRHELRSILRVAFTRLMDAGIDYKDLADRERATNQ